MNFTDFQISMGSGLGMDRERSVNLALFPVYEAIRLWVRAHKLKAPFEKVSLRLIDEKNAAMKPYFLKVRKAIGICQLEVPVDLEKVATPLPNYQLYISCAEQALEAIREQEGWQDEALSAFVRSELPKQKPPCNHLFGDLVKTDRRGTRWEVWLRAEYEHSAIVVVERNDDRVVEHVVAEEQGPLYLEDRFPLAKTTIANGQFSITDKRGGVLASVALEK